MPPCCLPQLASCYKAPLERALLTELQEGTKDGLFLSPTPTPGPTALQSCPQDLQRALRGVGLRDLDPQLQVLLSHLGLRVFSLLHSSLTFQR